MRCTFEMVIEATKCTTTKHSQNIILFDGIEIIMRLPFIVSVKTEKRCTFAE
jgi:hypothetical protein